ncbi:hypothetical protein IWW34DRAFT_801461 [Fusarium oxysporum f. sp. albedinis]|nr:hypothetical protein IWW34DRAFT_801461 [Fusarium oxysporum f. sp. albedinis]
MEKIRGKDDANSGVVTGSSRGIGAAIATRLAKHGAKLVINYVSSASAAESVAENIRSLGVEAIAIKADVSKPKEIAAMFQKAKDEFGRLDIVMSNSGIEHFGDLESVTDEEIDKVLGVNVKAQFFMAQQAYKHPEDEGGLILISSISAVWGGPRHALYSASKAAVQGMVKCLAWDFGSRGITVNCIAPGGVKTDMYAEAAANPLGRPGFPNDIAGVIAMLASSEAQWVTGQTIHASGGAHMG